MYVCVRACLHVHTLIYMYVCTYVHIYACRWVCVYFYIMCVCVYVYRQVVRVCMSGDVYLHVWTLRVLVCVYVVAYVHVEPPWVCIYIYMHACRVFLCACVYLHARMPG